MLGANTRAPAGNDLAAVGDEPLHERYILIIYRRLVSAENTHLRLNDELAPPLPSLSSIGFHQFTKCPPSTIKDLKGYIVGFDIPFTCDYSIRWQYACSLPVKEQHLLSGYLQAEPLLSVLAVI